MAPEERADEIMDTFFGSRWAEDQDRVVLWTHMVSAFRDAAAAEREACAVAAESACPHGVGQCVCGECLGAAIAADRVRARGGPVP